MRDTWTKPWGIRGLPLTLDKAVNDFRFYSTECLASTFLRLSVSMSMTYICSAQMSTASRNMLKKDRSEASNRFFRYPLE